MIRFAPITYEGALHVCQNMRQMDAEEIYATRWSESPEELAETCMLFDQTTRLVELDGEPVAVLGACPLHIGVWRLFYFATDGHAKVSVSVTKWIKRVMIPALLRAGGHRGECMSSSRHHSAHRWLEYLGFKREGTLRAYGKDREDFYLYGWSAEDHVHWGQRRGGTSRPGTARGSGAPAPAGGGAPAADRPGPGTDRPDVQPV